MKRRSPRRRSSTAKFGMTRGSRRTPKRRSLLGQLGSSAFGSMGSSLVDWFRGLISSATSGRKPVAIGESRPLGHFEPLEARQLLAVTPFEVHVYDGTNNTMATADAARGSSITAPPTPKPEC